MSLDVTIEHLVVSGRAVTGVGEDIAVSHTAADDRIEAARLGWQGRSAEALDAKAAQWAQTSRMMVRRLADHAQGLHGCANEFWAHERHGSEELDSLA